ncbi:NADH-quinone oxidoreductase subunit L [Polyangium sorediatum]|uniref:Proton-conducting transporter membrane subunit n=1 Tax=Polyangium sorediatum TaxID=889274 RepID=A0ABT6NSS5_9BACT|nr:proton-conducting transporter membrane subunit [Polyangium sorediatum]MDI1431341.1 proton-conducting transporter membrane subunit [Polyangium sorediatum]
MLERLAVLIPLLPLVAAILIGLCALGGRPLRERTTSRLALGATLLSFLGAGALLVRSTLGAAPATIFLAPWIETRAYQAPLEFLLDPLSASLALLVTGFGALVLKFSTNYMHREAGFPRFFAVMCFFLAAMLLLVLGGNLVMTFVGWEGAGLASYLLIGYHYDRKAPARAATYGFVTNRIGDAAFLCAIFIAWHELGTVRYASLFRAAETTNHGALSALGFCLLVAAAAKSAQLPFSPWISRAMEGPTPSSALFYGAVMVTAGLFLVLRMNPVLVHAPDVLRAMAAMGAATALYGGLVSLVQTDVKSGLIFSTVSQLGLMFLAVGLGARGIALFHLFAHALLRGAQFLTAPSTLLLVTRDEPSREERPVAGEVEPAFWLLLAGLLGVLALPFLTEIWAGPDAPLSPGAFLSAAGAGMALFCGGHYLLRFAQRGLANAGNGAEWKTVSSFVEFGPAWIAPAVVGAVSLSLGLAPGGRPHGLFHLVLDPLLVRGGLGRAAHPFWAFGLMLLLGCLLVAGWATALYFHRAAPERPGILPTRLRGLYVTALARFWLEPLYERLLLAPILRLGRALDHLDGSLLDRAFGRPLSPEDAPAPLATFQEKVLAGEIDDADPFAAVRVALERQTTSGAAMAHGDEPPPAPGAEDDFARGRGIAGRIVQYAAALANLIEKHIVRRAIGRGIPITGDLLGRTLDHVEALLERPVVVGALVVLSLFVVVRWAV